MDVHSTNLFDAEDIKDDGPEPRHRAFPVIDRYTIRATVRRVFVKPAFFEPRPEGGAREEEKEVAAGDEDEGNEEGDAEDAGKGDEEEQPLDEPGQDTQDHYEPAEKRGKRDI